MNQHLSDGDRVVVTPEMWGELFAILQPFIVSIAAWGHKHDLPLPVAEGAVRGAAEFIFFSGGGCDCDICNDVSDQMAGETADRMYDGHGKVRH